MMRIIMQLDASFIMRPIYVTYYIILFTHKGNNTQNVDKPNDKIIILDVCSYPHANNKCNMIGNIINLTTEASM